MELSPCAVCGRRFASERLLKHQSACKKVNKPRKQFNATAHRIAGSGAEQFQYKKKQAASNRKVSLVGVDRVRRGGKSE